MASIGPLSPGTMADDATVGTVSWTNPDNAKVSDNVYAVIGDQNITSHYLKATNFGFSIPTGATINGILVEIERKASSSVRVKDSSVKIVKADSTLGSTNKAYINDLWPNTDAYKSYGSSSDLWDETWTAENINDVDFGVVLSAINTISTTFSVDHIRITVYYTEVAAASTGNMFLVM